MSRVAELAILAAATWPALRLLSIPSMRREYDRVFAAVAVLLGVYAVGVTWTAVRHPDWLRPLAAAAAIGLLAERWRARPGYGTRRGLAPGSLGLFPRGPWVDDRFFAKQVARHGPIFKYSLQHRPCVCVLGAAAGSELFRAHADALEAPEVRFNRFVSKGFLRYMDPADHPFYKSLFVQVLDASILAEMEPELRRIARRGLARLEREGRVDPSRGCAPRPVLHAMVFEMLVAAFYGVHRESPEFVWLRDRYDDLDLRKVTLGSGTSDRDALALLEAWARRRGRAFRQGATGRARPACFLAALAASDGDVLEDETVLGNLVYVLIVARADLTALFTWIVALLGDAPEHAERLRSSVRSGSAAEGVDCAWRIVRETLRLEQSEYVYRIARREISFRGFRIPEGWRVRVLIREGHRDPACFEDPERFDPDRWSGVVADPRFQPFGLGAHACVGVPVTRSLSTLFLIELARGFDWRVVARGPREYGWAHWQPSGRLRLAVQRAPSAETAASAAETRPAVSAV